MLDKLTRQGQVVAVKMLKAQIAAALLMALVCLIVWGQKGLISSLLGGVAYIFPYVIFSFFFFRYGGATKLPEIMKSVYLGHTSKLLLSILIFLAVFQWNGIVIPALLLTYVASIAGQWIKTILLKL